jgi:hypothetical protein
VRFYYFHRWPQQASLTTQNIKTFLEDLVLKRNEVVFTLNQALNALVFFFRHVLEKDPENIGDYFRLKKPQQLPVVMT